MKKFKNRILFFLARIKSKKIKVVNRNNEIVSSYVGVWSGEFLITRRRFDVSQYTMSFNPKIYSYAQAIEKYQEDFRVSIISD